MDKLEQFLPDPVKKKLAQLKASFYVIDGRAVAENAGLGKHVNMVMQTVFFQLSGVLPMDKAIVLLKKSIEKAYSKKGAFGGKAHAAYSARPTSRHASLDFLIVFPLCTPPLGRP